MFEYEDPTGENVLAAVGALDVYRRTLHGVYRQFGRRPRTAFTIPEAFLEAGKQPTVIDVTWTAFPRLNNPADDQVEGRRPELRDEYLEWFTEIADNGDVRRVIFTT